MKLFSRILAALLFPGVLVLQALPRHAEQPVHTLLGSPTWQIGPIYYARGAPEPVVAAAQDLAATLGRITGTEWAVEPEPEHLADHGIFIGNTIAAAAQMATVSPPSTIDATQARARIEQAQTFRVKVVGRSVLLAGATPEATCHAVYWFLQNAVGVRWFIPGDIGEELPRSSRISPPPMDREITPSFYNRVLHGPNRSPGGKDWARRNLLTPTWQFNHALHRIVTPDLFETKPTWFSFVKGRRTPTQGGRGLNPNLVEAEVARFVAEEALNSFAKNPQQLTFSISTTDNINFDESPATLEIVTPYRYFRNRPDYSDLVFEFSNRVAESIWPLNTDGEIDFDAVPPEAQDKYLGALAYYWAENTPSFPVHSRIIPYLTSDRGQWFSEAYREEDKALIRAWCEAGPDIVGTWDYYEGGPYFIPRTFTGIVAESIPFLHEAGVRAFFAEGGARWGFDAPRLWLASQLLYDAEQNPQKLLKTFYTGYFGAAAEPMQAFYAICERQWMTQPEPVRWIKYYLMNSQAELFPLSVWNELETCLLEAEALADTDRVRVRLALVRDDWAFGQAACTLYYAWKALYKDPTSEPLRQALASARANLEALPEPQPLQWAGVKATLLEQTELPVADVPANAFIRFHEGFEEPLFFGDQHIHGPLIFRGGDFRDNWRTLSFHNESFSYQRGAQFAAEGEAGIRLEGATFFQIFQTLPTNVGMVTDARLRFRGQVSPGSYILLSLRWLDRDGKPLGDAREALVPVGAYPDWQTLAEQSPTPEGAEWLRLTLHVQEQMPGDYLELDDFQLTEWSPDDT